MMQARIPLFLTVVILGRALVSPALAQAPPPPPAGNLPDPLPAPSAPAQGEGWEPEFLKTLPRPPDQPRSLFQPPPPPGPPPPDLEQYFELDPLLDPPQWGKVGWFSDVRIDFIHPHLNFGQMRLVNPIPIDGRKVVINPGAQRLDWTAAPRIELGYRLPSGFGAFSYSARFFTTSGTGPFDGPAGMTTRHTRLTASYMDWDYISREFTPWDTPETMWTLTWRAGIRNAGTWTDTRVDKPFDVAARSNGVFVQGSSNYSLGTGPHFGLALERKDLKSGCQFLASLSIADAFTRVHQLFAASTTALNADGRPERGYYKQSFWNQVPILTYQVGLGWQPPWNPNTYFYAGYVYEYWFQIASNMNFTDPFTTQGATRGNMSNQGVFLQFHLKF
jgi:hypothetical protein